jgi:hypothetical protein
LASLAAPDALATPAPAVKTVAVNDHDVAPFSEQKSNQNLSISQHKV